MRELPAGWRWAKLSEVATINPRPDRGIEEGTPVSFVPMPGISADGPDFLFSTERKFGDVRKGFTHFADGDVLFAKITPCMENGKGAVATNLINGLGFGTTELHVLRPDERLDANYLYRFMQQRSFRTAAEAAFTGSAGQARVPVEFIRTAEIPLPPIDEQRHIVAKLDAVLGKARACEQRLDKVPTLLSRFRQAVLAAGCSGRLTAGWRESNQLDGSISEVLPRLRHRREGAATTPAQRDRIRGIYEEPEVQDSGELPVDWQFVKLNKLCGAFDYGTSAKSSPSGKVPVLRMGNLQDGKLGWTDLAYTSDADEIESYSLRPNTVLFNRTNSPELVGKTAIYRGERPAIFAGYLIRINPEPELDPEYLNLCLNAPEAKEFCRSVRTDGVSQSNINAQKLGAFEIPFCSIEEQREIVVRVNKLFALADRLQERLQHAQREVNRLTQSFLAQAFAGKLEPTPNSKAVT